MFCITKLVREKLLSYYRGLRMLGSIGLLSLLLPQLTAANTPPVANADTFTIAEDQSLTFTFADLLANDTDPDGDPLFFTSLTYNGGNGSLVVAGANTLLFTPNPNFHGSNTMTYTIRDGQGGSAGTNITIIVTPVPDPPINVPPTTTTIAEDTLTPLTGLGVQDPDDTTDKHTLTVNVNLGKLFLTGGPANLTGSGSSNLTVYGSVPQINAALTNLVKFLPPTNYFGPVTLTLTATNNSRPSGAANLDTDQLLLTVTPVNDLPIANPDYYTTGKNQPLILAWNEFAANDTDVDGNPLFVNSITFNGNDGNLTVGGNNTIIFTPSPNFGGLVTLAYTVRDGQGGTANGTAYITVVNRPSLTQPRFDRDRYQFNLLGEAGTKYYLETSSNLVHWTFWQSITPVTTNTLISDSTASSATRRFYRALIVP